MGIKYFVHLMWSLPSGSIRCPFPTRQYLRSAPRPMTALLQITLPWILHLEVKQTHKCIDFVTQVGSDLFKVFPDKS